MLESVSPSSLVRKLSARPATPFERQRSPDATPTENAGAIDANFHCSRSYGKRKSPSSIGPEIIDPMSGRNGGSFEKSLVCSNPSTSPLLPLATPVKRPHASFSWPPPSSKRFQNYGRYDDFDDRENLVPNTDNPYDVSTPMSLLRDHQDTLKSGPYPSCLRSYHMNQPGCTREEKGGSLCTMKSSTTGLCNLGNTCFMNGALQCLVHTPCLANFFLSKSYKLFPSDQKLGNRFADVIDNIYQNRSPQKMLNVAYSPDDFLKDFTDDDVAPQFGDSEQHDSHEFIRVFIDKLCGDLKDETRCRKNKILKAAEIELEKMSIPLKADYWWKEHLSSNSSFISDLFCGQLLSTTQCTICGAESYCFDPFYDISLPFPEKSQSARKNHYRRVSMLSSIVGHADLSRCSLDDCLREFTKEEVLEGDNMIECRQCCCKRVGIQRLQVFRFPKVLVLHLKRFSNSRKKVRTAVEFPTTDFDASALANQRGSVLRPIYDLYAVCNHSGRANYGHYTASCIDPHSSSWYTFNDESVSSMGGCDLDEAGAYILFYSLRE